jgi:endonuclease YncB( thermonuclease family)
MTYRLVRGTIQLLYQGQRKVGSRPDGDSVWFKPDRPALLAGIGGRDADFNAGGFAQLRLEGIDALELHYPSSEHQKEREAVGARDYLISTLLGFQVDYAPDPDIPRTVTSSVPLSRRGYVLTRAIDPYHRPVSFVFSDQPPAADGSDVFCDVAMLNKSVNAKLMTKGWAYPAYYTHRQGEGGLPVDLRDRLTFLSSSAYLNGWGVWGVDSSRTNPRVRNYNDLKQLAIWPKLFRRLAAYFDASNSGLANFDNWLRMNDKDDEVLIRPRGEMANLHDTVAISGDHITMLYWPEDLMVVPR